jgi:predicted transcriptional regulator
MKKPLLDIVFMSEKRKGALLLLRDGAKEMEYLLRSLGTNRQALLPQIRILENHYLVEHSRDTYELTTIGRMVVDKMVPLLKNVETFDNDIDYWGTRSLSFIPPHLLKRIDALEKSKVIIPALAEMHDAHQEYHESCMKSNSVFAVTTFLYPDFDDRFARFIESNITLNMVISKDLYNKLKRERYYDIKKALSSNLIHFSIYPGEMDFLSFGHNDCHFVITPLNDTGEFDNRYLLCSGQEALEWGKELFDYYLKDSIPITEL